MKFKFQNITVIVCDNNLMLLGILLICVLVIAVQAVAIVVLAAKRKTFVPKIVSAKNQLALQEAEEYEVENDMYIAFEEVSEL